MDPKPGRVYAPLDTQYVVPDVYVYKVGDEYVVSLNEDGLPRLRVSPFYKSVIQTGKNAERGESKETQDYIQEKLKSALWLIKSMHQRQKTIYRVTEAIMKHQRDFLDRGPSALRPLILKDIANEVGIHESTVSRVTSNKYVYTPQGIYELKYFFNSGISTSDGDGVASESVKLRIKALIEAEDPRRPLSDQDLVDKLKMEGIQMARRTVAKYRESLKILPSSRRKRLG
jgi:RNA polymerase sigma-54 factor